MHAGEDGNAVEARAQILFRHLLQFAAIHGQVTVARDAEGAGDGESGELVVAGDHDRADAGSATLGHGGFHFVTRRVHLPDESEERGAALELREASGFL